MNKHYRLNFLAALLCVAAFLPVRAAVELFPLGSQWKYYLGTNEVSSPTDAWRAANYDDGDWASGLTPIGYGEPDIATTLPESDAVPNYSSVYLRKTFVINNPADVVKLDLELNIDDGAVIWINGTEVGRDRVEAIGDLPFDAFATSQVEPHLVSISIIDGLDTLLVTGNNVVAVHLFNGALSSSDIYLDGTLSYLEPDFDPPTIADKSPAPGTINQLNRLTVTFSEPVTGVSEADLRVNGQPATSVSGSGATYTFSFAQPPYGTVLIDWNPAHGIQDEGIPPNPFDHTAPEASWQYQLEDVFPPIMTAISPSAGSTVTSLSQIQIRFSEPVMGVDTADLLINGSPATDLSSASASDYTFTFAEPPTGIVSVEWAAGHGIQDMATVPNSFTGGSWQYILDPTATVADVIISEFLASNGESFPGDPPSLQDEDGEYSDWIEIHNPGEVTVNLLNWSLTDDPDNLNRWRFPDTNILAGDFMIIFASGKNRREAGAPLHTDFQLKIEGEYLALVKPDGTIASEFNPQYPQQLRNVSFGYGFLVDSFTLIESNAPLQYLVPSDDSLGTNWTLPFFDDAAWTSGTTAVGYETGVEDPAEDSIPFSIEGLNPLGFWRFSETSGTVAANIGTLGSAANGTYSATLTLGQPGPRPPEVEGLEPDNTAPNFSGDDSVTTGNSLLSNRGAFTMGGWIKPMATQAARTGLFGQNDAVEFGFINATTIQIWTPGGGSLDVGYPYPINQWHHVAVVGNGTNLRVYYDGVQVGSGGAATANYGSSGYGFNIGGGGIFDVATTNPNPFNGLIDEVVVYNRALTDEEILMHVQASGGASYDYTDLINTDVQSAMHGVNSSIYLRMPFNVPDRGLVDRLRLLVQYDDGFQAYLNGVPVASRNAPEAPAWNSEATARNPDPKAVQFEEINLSSYAAFLENGTNVLAIQALNISATNTDFLISAKLQGTSIGTISPNERYFITPSPGEPNGEGNEDLGPIIRDVVHAPQVPNDDDDLLVTARVLPVFNRPITSFTLYYRAMFASEVSVPMTDSGLDGDAVAGDGIFSAVIPASGISNPGEMIRYRLEASDYLGNASRWPLYGTDIIGESQEYLGTVVLDPTLSSKLPIFQFFIEASQLGPIDTENGGRIAVYYDGELYDNVYMELRGNTTAGYLKKSHRLKFPRDHSFRHPGPGGRVRNTSFVADYGDPAYIRQGLSYWLGNLIGCPSPFYYPVVLNTNGVFYQMASHNNVTRTEMSAFLGYDDRGALYQAAGIVRDPILSTGNFRERPQGSSREPYFEFAHGIAETNTPAARQANVFDMMDLPQVINYLVTARWVHENDDVWANMSLYQDTYGDKLWRIVPFDMNLSWGAIYYEGGGSCPADNSHVQGVQATNDLHKSHPFYGCSEITACNSGNWNRVYDAIFDIPETRQMFLRRMRTMMDLYVKAPGTSPLLVPMEKHIRELHALMREEAYRDRAKWGWPARGGQTNFDPGIPFDQGIEDLINLFIDRRRSHFYVKHSVSNTGLPIGYDRNSNAGIPLTQPENPMLLVTDLDYNPSSGNQLEEYICLTNPNPYAVDISGWKIDGAVKFDFKPGTVIPSNRVVYVAADLNAFRTRAVGPRGRQGLFVVGNYQGQLSARGESIEVFDDKGRGVSTNTYPGNPSDVQQYLRITEMMYNPSPLAGNTNDAQNFEYIELRNIGPSSLNLLGVRFINGITFTFTNPASADLAAGGRVLLVKDLDAFTARYGAVANIAGSYAGFLNNGGERVRLLAADGEEILDFEYNNSWFPITDGLGFSLVIVNENAEPDLWNSKSNWRPSGQVQGTPGGQDPGLPVFAPIVVNEVLTHTDPPQLDSVELYNPTLNDVNLHGWYLSDDFTNATKFRIPENSIIAGRGYLVFDEDDFYSAPGLPFPFRFSSKGDEVFLLSGDPAGTQLTGYIDGFDFGAAENGVSFGRHTNSVGDVHIVPLAELTLNGPNSGPKVGPVVISEIMYHPPDVNGEDNAIDEFVELHNISQNNVSLYDPSHLTNTWRLANAVDYIFPEGVTMGPGSYLLVVGFNPADSAALSDFRSHYGVAPTVPVYGPWDGKLDNSDERIDLVKPDGPEAGSDEIPLIRLERVHYRDDLPWAPEADGKGPSLQRFEVGEYGNDPVNWVAAGPTPGTSLGVGEPPLVTQQPADLDAIATQSGELSVIAEGTAPLAYQWLLNGKPIEGATGSVLTLVNIILEDAGQYAVVVYNTAGVTVSSNAQVNVLIPANIFQPPVSVTTRPGSNVVFRVQVISSSQVFYQWRFNGIPISGETGDTLVLNNVQESNDGYYDVVVTDDVASIVSDSARLKILVNPLVTSYSGRYFAVEGGSVTMSIEASGTLPMTYRWRKNFGTAKQETIDSHVSFLTLNNLVPADGGSTRYTVVLTNEAFYSPGILSPTMYLTVLADSDGDGLPDDWEAANGVDDPNLDADNDGMTNGQEYTAGTDPQDPNSYLRISGFDYVGTWPTPEEVAIEFNAVSNTTYTVEFSDIVDQLVWDKLAEVPAHPTNRTVIVSDPNGEPKRFYRLVTPRQE